MRTIRLGLRRGMPPPPPPPPPLLLLLLLLLLSPSLLLADKSTDGAEFKLCSSVSIDLAMTAEQIQDATDCTVINGNLTISFVNIGFVQFHRLREVTDYVLLYGLSGLDSLDRLFPKLSVVRGFTTIMGYSIVLHDLTSLTSLGLPWLRYVGGQLGIRVDNSPLLCYLDTVHWSSILGPSYASMLHFNHVQHQSQCSNLCPGDIKLIGSGGLVRRVYKSDCLGQCWNRRHCQTVCSDSCGESGCRLDLTNFTVGASTACCHANCLAGCDGPTDRNCTACLKFRLSDQCVNACPQDYLELDNWICIPKLDCVKQRKLILDSACVSECPAGYESENGTCQLCTAGQLCRKHCPRSLTIRLAEDLDKVRGCNSLDALTISLSDNIPDLDARLHEAFSNLTEIRRYLNVVQSRDLKSLSFLSGLRVIGGQHLKNGSSDNSSLSQQMVKDSTSLRIQLTDFLQHLWNGTNGRRLQIQEGRVLFHRNQRLCPRTIVNFAENELNVTDGVRPTDLGYYNADNASNTNGNLALCIDNTFNLTVVLSNSSAILLQWPRTELRDSRYLLGYHVYYRLVPPGSPPVTYADPSTCEIRQWQSKFTQCYNLFSSNDSLLGPYYCYVGQTKTADSNCDGQRCIGNCCHGNTCGSPAVAKIDRNIQCSFLISGLEPASQYAAFIVPHIIGQTQAMALSRLALAATLPHQPSPPERLEGRALGSDSIRLDWRPPRQPNGNVTHYLVWKHEIPVQQDDFALTDYCDQSAASGDHHRSLVFLPRASELVTDDSLTIMSATAPSAKPTDAVSAACPKCQCQSDQKLKLRQRSEMVLFENVLLAAIMRNTNLRLRPSNATIVSRSLNSFGNESFVSDSVSDAEFIRRQIALRPSEAIPTVGHSPSSGVSDANFEDHFDKTALNMVGGGSSSSSSSGSSGTNNPVTKAPDQCRQCPASISQLTKTDVNTRDMPEGYTIVNGTSFVATELKYFVLYSFTVVACQGAPNSGSLCSHPARLMVRTAANRAADAVPAGSLRSAPPLALSAADDVSARRPEVLRLLWRRPAGPNGAVKYYEVDAANEAAASDVASKRRPYICVSYQEWLVGGPRFEANATSEAIEGGIALRHLAAGRYHVRVRAVTLRGYGDWSNVTIVDVAGPPAPYWLLSGLTPLLIAACSAAVVLACLTCWLLRCRRGQQAATIETVNPEYWSFTYEPDEWEVPRDQVTYSIDDLLGNGSFGCVYRGVVRSLNTPAARYLGRAEDVQVAVKNVSEKASMRERHEFLQEAAHMKKFRQCAHVVRLIGVVSENVPTLVLMELMENGDLKNCLRTMRVDADVSERRPKPDSHRLASWCAQIADGMYYLETKKYIHRDLAARNCMVTKDYLVKIGDFGMTRDVNYTDYYVKEGQAPLPIRWMAPESLRDGIFSTATDVWSYGVVLWEIASLAQQPFSNRSNEEVLQLVKSGKTLEPPDDSPDFMAKLMARCWVQKPRQRASFSELLACLEDLADADFRTVSWYHNRAQQQQQQRLDLLHQMTDNELASFPMLRAPMNGYV